MQQLSQNVNILKAQKVKEDPVPTGEKCPECGHDLVQRKSRFGTTFVGCSNYPKCRYIKKEPKKAKAEKTSKDETKKTAKTTRKSAKKVVKKAGKKDEEKTS